MYLTPGTTSRQLGVMAAWLWVSVIVLSMLGLWSPAYRVWGAILGSILTTLLLWLVDRLLSDSRTLPANPLHLVLLGPVLILAWHSVLAGIIARPADRTALAGALNLSMLLQLVVISVALLVTQGLLLDLAHRVIAIIACGLAMVAGSAAAITWGQVQEERSAVALMGFAGIMVFLAPVSRVFLTAGSTQHVKTWHPAAKLIFIAVPSAGAAVIAATSPLELLVSGSAVGVAALLINLVVPGRRVVSLLIALAGLAAGGLVVTAAWRSALLGAELRALRDFVLTSGSIGSGERGFAGLYAGNSGLVILLRTIGWGGVTWLVLGMFLGLGQILFRSQRVEPAERVQMMCWTAGVIIIGMAGCANGGLYVPSISLAAGFIWGLLPIMAGQAERAASGAWMLLGGGLLVLLLGLARNDGLAIWASFSYGLNDKAVHAIIGFYLSLILAWQLGAKRIWLGLVGITIAGAITALGELLQGRTSWRSEDMFDALAGSIGSLVALGPYMLSKLAVHCETAPFSSPGQSADRYLQ